MTLELCVAHIDLSVIGDCVWHVGCHPAWSITARFCYSGAAECPAAEWVCTRLLPCGKHWAMR